MKSAQILIVDDDQVQWLLLQDILARQGYRVTCVKSGEEAIGCMKASAPDLILLDVILPGIDGFGLCRLLREAPAWTSIPIIMMTALASREKRLLALEAGAQDFVSKPIDEVELRVRVSNLLRLKELYADVAQRNAELQAEVAQRRKMANALEERSRLVSLTAKIGVALTQKESLPESLRDMLTECARTIVRSLEIPGAGIWLFHPETYTLELQAWAGLPAACDAVYREVPIGDSLLGRLAQSRQLTISSNIAEDPEFADQSWLQDAGIAAFAGYPLIVDQCLLGAIGLFTARPLSASLTDALGTTADTLALGIERKHTAAALQHSEEYFRALIENAADLIVILDQDGIVNYGSPAVERVLAYPPASLLGQSFFAFVQPDDMPLLVSGFSRALRQPGAPHTVEFRCQRKDGGWSTLEGTCTSLLKNPAVTGVVINLRDISDRKRATEALRESEGRWQLAIAGSNDGIWDWDAKRNTVFYSTRWKAMLGYEDDEISNQLDEWQERLHPDDCERVMHAFQRHLAQETSFFNVEYRVQDKEGAYRWHLARGQAQWQADGAVLRMVGISSDMTERKQLEEAVRASEECFRLLSTCSPIGIFQTDVTGAYTYTNPQWLEINRLRPEEALGLGWLRTLSPYERADVFADWQDHVDAGQPFSREFQMIRPDGEVRWVHSRATAMHSDAGEQVGYVGTVEDITDRKRTDTALLRAREREIDIGFRIQHTLLLGQPPEDQPYVQIAAVTTPSQRIDGDFYDFFKHGTRYLDVVVGDVMGKGVPAALLGAATKSHLLRAMSELMFTGPDTIPSPVQIISAVHVEVVQQLIALESFITLCYIRLDLEEQRLDLVDCGHTRTIHWQHHTATCQLLQGENAPLGCLEQEVHQQVSFPFASGDLFVFYSDGLTEAENATGEQFGEERLTAAVATHGRRTPQEIVDAVRQEIVNFTASEAFADDLTCVVVKVVGEQGHQQLFEQETGRVILNAMNGGAPFAQVHAQNGY